MRTPVEAKSKRNLLRSEEKVLDLGSKTLADPGLFQTNLGIFGGTIRISIHFPSVFC